MRQTAFSSILNTSSELHLGKDELIVLIPLPIVTIFRFEQNEKDEELIDSTLSGKEICVKPLHESKERTPICSVPPKSISSIDEYWKALSPIIFVFFDKKICLIPA